MCGQIEQKSNQSSWAWCVLLVAASPFCDSALIAEAAGGGLALFLAAVRFFSLLPEIFSRKIQAKLKTFQLFFTLQAFYPKNRRDGGYGFRDYRSRRLVRQKDLKSVFFFSYFCAIYRAIFAFFLPFLCQIKFVVFFRFFD